MKTETTLNMLTQNSVSIKTQQISESNGMKFTGSIHRKAYVNSPKGREDLMSEIPEPYLSSVLKVWGTTATVSDDETII